MRNQNSLIYHVIVFIIAQVAWFSLLSLWIYWYVSNYILLSELGENVTAQTILENINVGSLIGGIILLIAISLGMSLIFVYLTRQLNLTRFYDNFIANVTHELKSPLSSIQLYLETLKKRKVSQATRQEFIDTMLRDTDRLNKLITSILDVSGLEQKKLAYDFEVFPAQEVIKSLLAETVQEFQLGPDSVHSDGELKGEVVLDRRACKMVFNNLFDNAIKYSGGSVFIRIELSQNQKYYIIKFSDQGVGISSSAQKKIFKKFERIYKPDSPTVKGTGLGLYLVREIIRAHGGSITVASAGRDQGTTFKITLPIYRASKRRLTNRLLKLASRRRQKTTDDYAE